MFPKLSQKAWVEICKNLNVHPDTGIMTGYYFQPVDVFMSLFDPEKYPITKDMIFEYLLKADFEDRLPNGLHSTKENWEFWNRDADTVGCHMLIKDMLYWMSIRHKDQIIIIGEIHGWWEKGEQK